MRASEQVSCRLVSFHLAQFVVGRQDCLCLLLPGCAFHGICDGSSQGIPLGRQQSAGVEAYFSMSHPTASFFSFSLFRESEKNH